MTQAGDLRERFAFDFPHVESQPSGVNRTIWAQGHACRAEVIYRRGSEVVEAARREGRAVFKLRIRQCAAARAITSAWRARDVRRGLPAGAPNDELPGMRYNITEIDAVTDRQWIFIGIESGKAA